MGSRGPRRRLSTWQVVTVGAKVARSRVRNPVAVLTTAFAPSLNLSDPRVRAAPRYSGRSGSGGGQCGRGGTITGSTSPRSFPDAGLRYSRRIGGAGWSENEVLRARIGKPRPAPARRLRLSGQSGSQRWRWFWLGIGWPSCTVSFATTASFQAISGEMPSAVAAEARWRGSAGSNSTRSHSGSTCVIW